ncbi:MAG TPA: hypothetical protein VHX15_08925 [Frankiaceae bacterium]|jgi:hypothetical protein|nr:hypothetical protein [Frankiaceae bacterium]
MRGPVLASYNWDVPTTATPTPPAEPGLAAAGLFLEQLATADFASLAVALEPDAHLRALLPRRFREWQGREAVCDGFTTMLGGMDAYTVLDATVGLVGSRLQLAWRMRVSGGRLGPADFVVEQQAYADAGPTGRIQSISLVCSGFCQEHFPAIPPPSKGVTS